jgi:transposase-like protein
MPKSKRQYPAKLKFQAVLEVLKGQRTAAQVAKVYRVHPQSLLLWRETFLERGPSVFERQSGGREYEKRIAELEQLLGKKEVEIALLKNFLGRSE